MALPPFLWRSTRWHAGEYRLISMLCPPFCFYLHLCSLLYITLFRGATGREDGGLKNEQASPLFLGIILVSAVLFYALSELNSSQGYSGKNTLTIYNWGDYIDTDLIKRFEKETGIKVIYETFDSNEAMLTKIQQGGTTYDIAVPSEYMIDKMRKEHLLIPLDHSKLPNLKNIDPRFMDLPFDEGNKYSVPYFWGTVGIVFNPKMLNGKKITSWNDLWDPDLRNKILLVDGAREIMGMGLNSLGYSLNDTNHAHLQEAKRKLDTLTPNIKAIVGDEIRLFASERGSFHRYRMVGCCLRDYERERGSRICRTERRIQPLV